MAAQNRILSIFNGTLNRSERKFVWDSVDQNLIDFQLKFNEKCQDGCVSAAAQSSISIICDLV